MISTTQKKLDQSPRNDEIIEGKTMNIHRSNTWVRSIVSSEQGLLDILVSYRSISEYLYLGQSLQE
jgi:hypothetical protein